MPKIIPLTWNPEEKSFSACFSIELSRVPNAGELICVQRTPPKPDCNEHCPNDGNFEVLAIRHTPGADGGDIDADVYLVRRDLSAYVKPIKQRVKGEERSLDDSSKIE